MAKTTKKAQTLSFDALPVKQGKHEFFLFYIQASTLWSITEINRRSEDKDEGYQRAISSVRVKTISKYVQSGGMLAGCIVVSFDEGVYDKKASKLRVPNSKKIGWIIDGQHRLAGAHEASKGGTDLLLPVIAFLELPLEQQVELFITINKEARGVPASLYIDLLKDLPKKKTDREITDERIADIARELDRDELSPFNQRIIFTRNAKAGEISLNNFARVLRPHLTRPAGIISLYTPAEQEGAINNYYKALALAFPKAFKHDPPVFFRTIGFGAAFRAFPYVFNLTQAHHKAFSVSAIGKVLAEISDFNFEAWKDAGTGTAAEIGAGEDLVEALNDAFSDGDGGGIALKLT